MPDSRAAAAPASRKLMLVAGTRPECIKLAPLVAAIAEEPSLACAVVNSGQHVAAVADTLAGFGIAAAASLPALARVDNLRLATLQLEHQLAACMSREGPDMVVVQGDTLTAFAGARAARRCGLPLAHVEAGLRTPDPLDPFPEEWFRRRIARCADRHFAPCRTAVAHLLAEGIPPERIHLVGNTGIDALRALLERWRAHGASPARIAGRVLVTLHRRENWDRNADVLCDALIALTRAEPGVSVVFPVHPNPRIAPRIRRRLGRVAHIELVAPLPYPEFVRAMASASLLVSDSGGVQEEAPHLGVPLLVPRANTERPEALATGFVELVQVELDTLVACARARLRAALPPPLAFDAHAPFGAGDARRTRSQDRP